MRRACASLAVLVLALSSPNPARAYDFVEPDRTGTIEVLDPGQAPLTTLRYDWTVGDSEAVRFAFSRTETQLVNEQPTKQYETNPIVLDAEVTVATAFDDGTFEVVTEIVDAFATDDDEFLATSLESLVGFTMRERYDTRGIRSSVERTELSVDTLGLHPAIGAVPEVIGKMVLELPEEPIGIGGTWQLLAAANSDSGFELAGRFRNTVRAIEPDGTLLIESSEDADDTVTPQTVHAPELPPGADLIFDAVHVQATNRRHLDPTTPMPAYEGWWTVTIEARIESNGTSMAQSTQSAATVLSVAPEGLTMPSVAGGGQSD